MKGVFSLEQRTNESGTKIYVEGHGCSASFADTEMIQGALSNGGYLLVDDSREADLNIIVTCGVKSVTEQRMISRISQLSSDGKKLIVAGCLPKADPDKILKMNPNFTLIGPDNLDVLLPAVKATISGDQLVSIESKRLVKLGMPRTRKNKVVGIVEIASGCLSSCTFCQVKLVKGTVFSYPEEQIIREAERLIEQGAREIWLTSTDNSAYGRDSRTNIAHLLSKICEIEGEFMVRVGMMNPLLTQKNQDELIDSFSHPKVFKFLHLPVQSGSDRILREMQRGYSADSYFETVRAFRSKLPCLTLSTDIIVGFPSESESEFEESMELIRLSRPDIVNISRFGAREGTKAAIMDNQIDSRRSKDRSTRMTHLVKEISAHNNRDWMNWKGQVLLDEVGKGAVIGRNFAYKPCVIVEEEFLSGEPPLGEFAIVRVCDFTSSTLRATLAEYPPC